jgi:hypothetical protein
MSDPLNALPSYSPSPDREPVNSDVSSTSNIPISDFRRNEARPIIADDGNSIHSFFNFFIYKHVIYILRSIQIDISSTEFINI